MAKIFHAPNKGTLGSLPGQKTGSSQELDPVAATKIQGSQINK